MLNICVPVLKRYDLLRDMLRSLRRSTLHPDMVYVINNGRDKARLAAAMLPTPSMYHVHQPHVSMGVAESWNWFIENVCEERVIVNDDITFAPESLKKLTASKADIAWAKGCGFSCFLLRDSCVQKIGSFDETISPGYGYYEDEDYLQRIDGRGTRAASVVREDVDCNVRHYHSGTLKAASTPEMEEHHRRFKIAQANYARKWALEEAFK